MVDYLPRSAWGARPAKPGPGNLTVSRVEGAVLHWPGMGARRPHTQAEVASALRGWQAYHMDPKPAGRGWSDIAYQVAVDQAGRAWTLRGLRTQSGANGNQDVNERFGAVLLVVGTGEQPTPQLIDTTRAIIGDFRGIYPDGTGIEPHSAVRPDPTDCPGPIVRALIASGAFEPTQMEDDMPLNDADKTWLTKMVYAQNELYGKNLWAASSGTGTALRAQVAAILKAVDQSPEELAAAIAADVVAKLPAGHVDQATVEAGVRAVLLDAATAD